MRGFLSLLAMLTLGACSPPRFELATGTRVTLVIDSQPPLHPEVAAALAPVTDTARFVLTVTRATPDTIVGTHVGDLAHFPIQVTDEAGPVPFVATRTGSRWTIDLHPYTIDAGISLELDLRQSGASGRWVSRSPNGSTGRFWLSAPGT